MSDGNLHFPIGSSGIPGAIPDNLVVLGGDGLLALGIFLTLQPVWKHYKEGKHMSGFEVAGRVGAAAALLYVGAIGTLHHIQSGSLLAMNPFPSNG